MEIGFCTRFLTLRGVTSNKINVPINSSKKRYKPQDAHRIGKLSSLSNLSTQSCQPKNKILEENRPRKTHVPAFKNVELFRNKIAVSDGNGDYLYEDVYLRSWDLAKGIIDLFGDSSPSRRICLLCPPDLTHVIATWSCWMSGHVAVPLCSSSHQDRLEHILMESKSDLVITTVDQVNRVHAITKKHGQKLIVLDETWWMEPKNESDLDISSNLPQIPVDLDIIKDSTAYILYTSGMTGKPKGVVYNHQTVYNQIENVVHAWDLSSTDSVLHSLALDTVYGSINSLQAPLSTGARITLVPNFDTTKIWSNLLGVGLKSGKPLAKINTFPSIPQVYTSLLKSYTELFKDKKTKEYVKTTCGKRIRIMISSTSSLPLSVSSQWKTVTGQFRYQKCEREKENNHFALKLKTQTMNNEIY